MTSPFSLERAPRRTVEVAGKTFAESKYKPQYAIGFFCTDEDEQKRLFQVVQEALPQKEVLVLVV